MVLPNRALLSQQKTTNLSTERSRAHLTRNKRLQLDHENNNIDVSQVHFLFSKQKLNAWNRKHVRLNSLSPDTSSLIWSHCSSGLQLGILSKTLINRIIIPQLCILGGSSVGLTMETVNLLIHPFQTECPF